MNCTRLYVAIARVCHSRSPRLRSAQVIYSNFRYTRSGMTRRAFAVCLASVILPFLPLGAAPARKSPAFDGTFVNRTPHDLVRTESALPSGKWCGEPPELIKPGQTVSFCAEGPAGSGGTQGSVTYK